jgi:UDP-glucose 4-epimerase
MPIITLNILAEHERFVKSSVLADTLHCNVGGIYGRIDIMKRDLFDGKVLLITGGTGSFGGAVLKHFLKTGIKEIRIFSRDEKKQDDMRKQYNNDKLKFYIGDVRSIESVREAAKGADYIFHAAALKQVPSCEFFPMEAVRTNVIGTDNVLTAAIDTGVKKVVCLSTDKAAYPINAMGTSKAMMEKIIIAKSRIVDPAKTTIALTRYGNVMCSRGSVIPLFIDQIKAGKDLTVTDPNMTRFLMNLDEAVELVLFAFENARQGDLFIQKAPASTIGDLAHAMVKLFKSNSKVRTIGTRHGEKLNETLMTREEAAKSEDMGNYFRIPADNRDLNYDKYFEDGDKKISRAKEYTSDNTKRLDVDETIAKVLTTDYVKNALKGRETEYV